MIKKDYVKINKLVNTVNIVFFLFFVFVPFRLSKMASAKLRDNNPNIADLSDMNRPQKLAEQFSELYDNEWTDAYTMMENKLDNRQIIVVLLDIVMVGTNEL